MRLRTVAFLLVIISDQVRVGANAIFIGLNAAPVELVRASGTDNAIVRCRSRTRCTRWGARITVGTIANSSHRAHISGRCGGLGSDAFRSVIGVLSETGLAGNASPRSISALDTTKLTN